MASTSETGHAKNVANFDELISFITGYGKAYNPTKTTLQLSALKELSALAKNAINQVHNSIPVYRNAVATRKVAFKRLSKLVTRIKNSLIATDASQQIVDSAKTLVRKIQGKRITPKKSEEQKEAQAAEDKEIKEVSTSQMSYDNRVSNFDKLIKLLENITEYTPNEVELKVKTLTTLHNTLKQKNDAITAATTPLSNARISRNQILYSTNTGLIDVAMDTKAYIKSVFGATSPQFKQISKLLFTSIKIQ